MRELKLNEFHTLYVTWKQGIPWFDHLLLGLLVKIERWVINNRVKTEVDTAVERFHAEVKKVEPDYVTPIYTETFSEGSTSLPEMRLTAPWYEDSLKEVKRDTELSGGV